MPTARRPAYGYGYSFYDNNAGVEYSTVTPSPACDCRFFQPGYSIRRQALGIPTARPTVRQRPRSQPDHPIVAAFYGPPGKPCPAISINFRRPTTRSTPHQSDAHRDGVHPPEPSPRSPGIRRYQRNCSVTTLPIAQCGTISHRRAYLDCGRHR